MNLMKKRSAKRRAPQPRAVAPPNASVTETTSPRLMSLNDACRYGGFGRMKAYELIHTGKIIAVKLDHRTMINVASIDAFIATLPRVGQ